MIYEGPAFYDDDAIFKTYMSRRGRENNPNDTLEKPIISELIGNVMDKRILDLGCGDASFGREALARGCQSYLGIEGSNNMVESAQQNLAGTQGKVVHSAIETWEYPSLAFDLVVSRLVLHYIQDLTAIFKQVMRPHLDGRFVLSVRSPHTSQPAWQGTAPGPVVDNYLILAARQYLDGWS
jgi:trans-aconitate methyltransferase